MKKIITIVGIVALVLFGLLFAFRTYTKSHSPAAQASYDKNGLAVTVDYCRPSKKGREIFGQLLPYGQVWRTGANEATLISFKQPVTVAGKPIAAGEYTLWTIPTASDWTVIINKETGQWGTNYDEKQDLLRVAVPSQQQPTVTEQLLISFADQPDGADMVLNWDKTQVTVPIRKQ